MVQSMEDLMRMENDQRDGQIDKLTKEMYSY